MLHLKLFIKRIDSISWDPTLYSILFESYQHLIEYKVGSHEIESRCFINGFKCSI